MTTPQQDDLFTSIGAALQWTAERYREEAADTGCSAGNFDGGSAWSCEHCQALQGAAHLDGLATQLGAVAADVGRLRGAQAQLEAEIERLRGAIQALLAVPDIEDTGCECPACIAIRGLKAAHKENGDG